MSLLNLRRVKETSNKNNGDMMNMSWWHRHPVCAEISQPTTLLLLLREPSASPFSRLGDEPCLACLAAGATYYQVPELLEELRGA